MEEPVVENNKPTVISEEDQIVAVKKQFPNAAFRLSIEGDEEGEEKVCYLKEINRNVHEQALGLMMKTKGNAEYLRAGEVILLQCWLTGDNAIKTEDAYLRSACMQAYELMELKSATLKKI